MNATKLKINIGQIKINIGQMLQSLTTYIVQNQQGSNFLPP